MVIIPISFFFFFLINSDTHLLFSTANEINFHVSLQRRLRKIENVEQHTSYTAEKIGANIYSCIHVLTSSDISNQTCNPSNYLIPES